MSGRSLHYQPDGRWTVGARKTLARRPRIAPHLRPEWRVTILLPDSMSLVSPGPTGIVGVTVEQDQFSGPMLVGAGHQFDWVLRQIGAVLLRLGTGMDRTLSAVIARGQEPAYSLTVDLRANGVEFPARKGRSAVSVWR